MRVWHVLVIVGIMLVTYSLCYMFIPGQSTYLVKNATVEQVEQMVKANPDGRVWYQSANLIIAQGSNLLEVTFRARSPEKGRITEFLDSIGVQYSEISYR